MWFIFKTFVKFVTTRLALNSKKYFILFHETQQVAGGSECMTALDLSLKKYL